MSARVFTAALIAATVLDTDPASANPTLEAKVRELESKLREAQDEIRRLQSQKPAPIECERADLDRRSAGSAAPSTDEVGRFLERLAGRPVDPVYDRRMIGMPNARPIGFMVRPGCGFLGGDRITEVDGVPVADTSRVRALIQQQDRWRLTVAERGQTTGSFEAVSDREAFDLARALGVSGREAKVVPYSANAREQGFLVWSVTPGGYLASAGLEPKDILVSVNRIPLSHAEAEAIIKREWKTKGRLAIEVLRDGRPFFLRTIAAGPGGGG